MTIFCAYHADLRTFLDDCTSKRIGDLVNTGVRERFDAPSDSEQRSWKESLPKLAALLVRAGISEADVFAELQMPISSKRCDVLVLGLNQEGRPTAIVFELKRWSIAAKSFTDGTVRVLKECYIHPSIQCRDYVDWLKAFHGAFSDNSVAIRGFAYLHNLRSDYAFDVLMSPADFGAALELCPLIRIGDEERLIDHVRRHVGHGRVAGGRALILESKIAPASNLFVLLVETIERNRDWVLMGEQRIVFSEIIAAVAAAIAQPDQSTSHRLIIVRGGAGTGKSVLAIQLLAHAARQGWRVAHATGSKAFLTVLQGTIERLSDALLKKIYNVQHKNRLPVKHLFTTFREIAKLGAKQGLQLDLVIGDEAHRLWDVRRQPRTYKPEKDAAPMIEEILRAAPVTVMFLDDNQSIRAHEVASVEYLETQAQRLGVHSETLDLTTQFRCGGSISYIQFIENRLGLDQPISIAWKKYAGYEFEIFSDFGSMRRRLASLMKDGRRCRTVAGFCWRWSEPAADGSLPEDITDPRLGGTSASWIMKSERDAKPLQSRYFRWVNDDTWADQVGSIYSVQGFEFDYVAVLFGDDLVIRNGEWHVNLARNKDGQFKDEIRRREKDGEPIDVLARVRNIYQVLLTRAMKGTFVFFLDEETRLHFEQGLNVES